MRRRYPTIGAAYRRMSRQARAFTLIEVLFAMFLFVLMAAMVTAALTAATRTARSGNTYAQAMSLAQRKLDQLQEQGFTALETGTTAAYPTSISTSGQIIDASTSLWTSHSLVTTGAGSGYEEAFFTTTDKLSQFFPSNAVGTMDAYPYGNGIDTTGATALTMMRVVITISWTERTGNPSSYSVNAIISKNVDQNF